MHFPSNTGRCEIRNNGAGGDLIVDRTNRTNDDVTEPACFAASASPIAGPVPRVCYNPRPPSSNIVWPVM